VEDLVGLGADLVQAVLVGDNKGVRDRALENLVSADPKATAVGQVDPEVRALEDSTVLQEAVAALVVQVVVLAEWVWAALNPKVVLVAAVRAAALEAHTRFQGGYGSGGDVAAAVGGGVVEVRRADGDLKVAPSLLPHGLELVVAWSGTSAHTLPLVARFAQVGTCPSLSELGTTAEAAADAAMRDDAEDFCVAVARAGVLLEVVGRDLDLPIVTPALRRLMDVAQRLGIAAKPSGAGAGDCAIAFARSPAEAEALRAAWRDAGFVLLPLEIAREGVRVA